MWNTPTNPRKLKQFLLSQPLRSLIIFFDYAGTTEGRYKGIRPALMFIRKEFVTSVNQISYIKTRSSNDPSAIIIPENRVDDLVAEILKSKDEFGNLKDYGTFAAKTADASLANLSGTINKRTPDIDINPLDDK